MSENNIIGVRVDLLTYSSTVSKIITWSRGDGNNYVSVANVHVVMEAFDNPEYKKIINNSLVVTPDGVPLLWGLKLFGNKNIERVYGPYLTLFLCRVAAEKNIPVGFFGSNNVVLNVLKTNLMHKYPTLRINYYFSPPFRPLEKSEDDRIIEKINKSGIKILFVGLGCPKQEKWMYEHRNKINAIMIGVGAAFDFIAGVKRQAPRWMQNIGMEWFFRLLTEPKRLWKRYLYHNPRFIFYFTLQLLGFKKFNVDD